MDNSPEFVREMNILEEIERDPDVTQASLADQLGVAVGTVNWHLKRLVSKGYVKVKRAQRRKLRYIITPEGLALRARLTVEYVERSFRMYRKTRQRVGELLDEVRAAGHSAVRIADTSQGQADIVDVCYLTCLEQGVEIVDDGRVPVLEVQGWKVTLRMDEADGRQ